MYIRVACGCTCSVCVDARVACGCSICLTPIDSFTITVVLSLTFVGFCIGDCVLTIKKRDYCMDLNGRTKLGSGITNSVVLRQSVQTVLHIYFGHCKWLARSVMCCLPYSSYFHCTRCQQKVRLTLHTFSVLCFVLHFLLPFILPSVLCCTIPYKYIYVFHRGNTTWQKRYARSPYYDRTILRYGNVLLAPTVSMMVRVRVFSQTHGSNSTPTSPTLPLP